MAIGVRRLQKIQMGRESTAGTAVAATSIWRGQGKSLDDQRVIEVIEEMVGILEGADRTAVVELTSGLELAETPLTFEQFPYIVAMALGGPTTGSQDGSGSDYLYTANIATNALPTKTTYTFQTGDNNEAERMEYCFVQKFGVKLQAGQTARMSATVLGRQVAQNSFTGSLSIPTVEEAITSKGKVYLDAISGTYGTTQVSSQIIGGEINYEIKWAAQMTMDGNLYFSTLTYGGHTITGNLTFLHDANVNRASGEKLNFANQTARKLRIDLIGGAVTTAGTTYSTKKAIFDLPLKWTKASTLTDNENNNVVTMDFRSRHNLTSAESGKIITVNELSSLT